MKRFFFALFSLPMLVCGQSSPLSVAKIMQDPKTWIGAWPSNPYWTEKGDVLYFYWNPKGAFPADSLYKVSAAGGNPEKVTPEERRRVQPRFSGWYGAQRVYTRDFSHKVFTDRGDLYLYNAATQQVRRLTQTLNAEEDPRWGLDDDTIRFIQDDNVFQLQLSTGLLTQLTDIRHADAPPAPSKPSGQEAFLREQQRALFQVIRQKQDLTEQGKQNRKADEATQHLPKPYYLGKKNLQDLEIDPSGRFVTFRMVTSVPQKNTIVQQYVTEDGYAADLRARAKVGQPSDTYETIVMDLKRDTTYAINLKNLPAASLVPDYLREQGVVQWEGENKRSLIVHGPVWRSDGQAAVVEVRAYDNKDRWIARLTPETGELTVLDHQHDEAWIGGPGISWWGGMGTMGWLPDNRHVYFQSEKTGYSHLYTVDVTTKTITQLTNGTFEVFSPMLSKDGMYWYFTSSEGSPYERHLDRMRVEGGARERLTTLSGKNEAALHPNEQLMGLLYSFSNRPPEIYLQKPRQAPTQITQSVTEAWKAYTWRVPEIIEVPASDGAKVPARFYKPAKPNGAAVIFVHGAGYLQNVHRWWSTYFREYMFHNLLTDLGYYVLDLDYRASEGYGRDWRTAIYRHMGGRDLQDHVDGSKFLQKTYRIDPERIGIYGGSYGGFITLMTLFTEPKHFGAGAALRSVTDWAHYNHGYTANILNTPALDSLAIARSSPIYYAEGLEDPLLICHGVVDTNVHFQDVVRLSQRLIELGKENWEMAIYPVEDHGFVEPSSWTDEYRRILKLFEEHIGNRRKR